MKLRWPLLLFPLLVGACLCPLLSLVEPLEVGTQAPAFTLPSTSGDTVSLSDFGEQVVLLNFWSAG